MGVRGPGEAVAEDSTRCYHLLWLLAQHLFKRRDPARMESTSPQVPVCVQVQGSVNKNSKDTDPLL